MDRIQKFIQRFFPPARPLPAGIYPYQAPPDSPTPYRLHLRLEPNGEGILIINASTVLHLNQTAAEMAYYLVRQTPLEEVGRYLSSRYHIRYDEAQRDFTDFKQRLDAVLQTPDLDPIGFLGFDQAALHSATNSAPYRIDCALTYRLPERETTAVSPLDRVGRELTTQEWQTVLQKAWQAGIPHVVFTGGEATLRPDLPELIAHAEQLGMVTGLLTEGLRLADPAYLRQILAAGLDHLMILLNPGSERSWKSLQDSLSEDISVVVHLTVNSDNAGQIPAMIDRLAEMGVSQLSLSAVEPSLKTSLEQCRQKSADKGLRLVWDLPVPYSSFNPVAFELSEEEQPRGAGRAWIYVEPDGDVLPGQGRLEYLGNLLSDTWESMWGQQAR